MDREILTNDGPQRTRLFPHTVDAGMVREVINDVRQRNRSWYAGTMNSAPWLTVDDWLTEICIRLGVNPTEDAPVPDWMAARFRDE